MCWVACWIAARSGNLAQRLLRCLAISLDLLLALRLLLASCCWPGLSGWFGALLISWPVFCRSCFCSPCASIRSPSAAACACCACWAASAAAVAAVLLAFAGRPAPVPSAPARSSPASARRGPARLSHLAGVRMALIQVLAGRMHLLGGGLQRLLEGGRGYCLRESFRLLFEALLSLAGLAQLLPFVVVQRRLLLRILKPLRCVLHAPLDLRQAVYFVREFLSGLLLPHLVGRVLRLLGRLLQLLRGGLRGRLRGLRAVLAQLLPGFALVLLRALGGSSAPAARRSGSVWACLVWFCRFFC